MFQDETDKQPDETPCAVCGNPSECEAWGQPLCYPCYSEWFAATGTNYLYSAGAMRAWVEGQRKSRVVLAS